MSQEREYIVILRKGVDIEQFDTDMIRTTGTGGIPRRSVDVVDPRSVSRRMTHYALTAQEVENLKKDPRVLDVEIPPTQRQDIELGLNYTQPSTRYTKNSDFLDTDNNWGLVRVQSPTNLFGSGLTLTSEYEYPLDGSNVDIVIQDTGIEPNHPEWQDRNGVTRLRQINWENAAIPGLVQNANHYRDYHGHGTHVGGTAAGKTYGFAKNANIYAQKILGLEGDGDEGTGINQLYAFDAIRLWHNNKETNSITGRPNPTVVNMSWGYSSVITTAVTGGTFRGASWTAGPAPYNSNSNIWLTTGVVSPIAGTRRLPVRVSSVDVEIEEMIEDGIHVCIASGNRYTKIDVPDGQDYDNSVQTSTATYFYHRGGSPYSENAFMVGNISEDLTDNLETSQWSSNKGPGVNIWAPGTNIISACSDVYVFPGSTVKDYYADTNFKMANIGGTSMASPQVAGVIALHLQDNPTLTPETMKERIINDSKAVVYSTGNDSDYTSQTSIMGSPNRFLFNRYSGQPFSTSGSFTATQIELAVENETPEWNSDNDFNPATQSYTIQVTNSGASAYTLSGSDRNGAVSGDNVTVTVRPGDTVDFVVNAPGHPFYIKTAALTGTGSQVTTPVATNQGAEAGTVSWTPNASGTYYYICQFHGSMQGQIVVS